MANNKMIILLCEGESEVAYTQELNRYLRDNEHNVVFVPKLIGSGFYTDVDREFKKEKKDNPRSLLKIFLDDDIYVRNGNTQEQNNNSRLASSPFKEAFLFNTHNFEDFLMLHCDDDTLGRWLTTCVATNHEHGPMHSAQYVPLVKGIFPNYKKGELPISPIDKGMLENLYRHNDDGSIFIKSAFATYLKDLLAES